MSSLCHVGLRQKLVLSKSVQGRGQGLGHNAAYRLLLVALEICSSRADPADDDHHPIMLCSWANRAGVAMQDVAGRTRVRSRSWNSWLSRGSIKRWDWIRNSDRATDNELVEAAHDLGEERAIAKVSENGLSQGEHVESPQ